MSSSSSPATFTLMAGPELIAERLLDALKAPIKIGEDETPITVTASIGIATGDRAQRR